MPVPTASAANPATRMKEIRFEMVIVKKSLDAANAITVGKIISRAASMSKSIMGRLVERCGLAESGDVGSRSGERARSFRRPGGARRQRRHHGRSPAEPSC
jgi:hypothetical protein